MMASATTYEIFEGLPPALTEAIVARLKTHRFPSGMTVLREGQANNRIMLVEAGSLAVWRGEPHSMYGVQVARLNAGSCFGERSIVRPGAASASIVATADVTLRELTLAELPSEGRVRQKVTLNLARLMARRLAATHVNVQRKHTEQVETVQRVAATSAFVTRNLVALACCMFSLPVIAARELSATERALFSIGFGALFFGIAWQFVRRSQSASAVLGLTWRKWPRQIGRALPLTLALVAVVTALKWALVASGLFGAQVFEPGRVPALHGVSSTGGWVLLAALFVAGSVALEFTRCTIQGSLVFLFDSRRRLALWGAMIAANTLCAASQVYIGPVSTFLIFVLGLFWGWLFARERSFLAAALSHAVVGFWSVFILGLPE